MVVIEQVIAKVTELRQACADKALGAPDRERPELAYGEAVGRDAAFAMVLEAITELIDADTKAEED